MLFIVCALIGIIVFFIVELYWNRISKYTNTIWLSTIGMQTGRYWFLLLFMINMGILIFIPAYFYYREESRRGTQGSRGIAGPKGDDGNISV